MKLKKLANIRIGLPLIRKKGNIHDDIFFQYKVVTLKSFSENGTLIIDEIDEFIAKEEISKNYITQKGDILVRLREPNIAVYIDECHSGLIVPSLMAIVKPETSVNCEYLTYFINSLNAQNQLKKELQGTTIPMLKASELANLEVILPSEEIQNKIVSLLKLANKEIQLLDQLNKQKIQFKSELLDVILKKEFNK